MKEEDKWITKYSLALPNLCTYEWEGDRKRMKEEDKWINKYSLASTHPPPNPTPPWQEFNISWNISL